MDGPEYIYFIQSSNLGLWRLTIADGTIEQYLNASVNYPASIGIHTPTLTGFYKSNDLSPINKIDLGNLASTPTPVVGSGGESFGSVHVYQDRVYYVKLGAGVYSLPVDGSSADPLLVPGTANALVADFAFGNGLMYFAELYGGLFTCDPVSGGASFLPQTTKFIARSVALMQNSLFVSSDHPGVWRYYTYINEEPQFIPGSDGFYQPSDIVANPAFGQLIITTAVNGMCWYNPTAPSLGFNFYPSVEGHEISSAAIAS